ncbi:MAG: VOC family protein [Candidatus Saccharimonadales bacterium]
MSDNPVVHFEMPYEDAKRVADFYKKAFGWDMNAMGEQMGNYIVAATAETDENRMVKTPGTINGGFYLQSSAPQSKEPSVVISVNDIRQAMEDIKKAGGKLVQDEPMEIPGIGLYVAMRDTEGNRVGVLQPSRKD